MRSIPERRIASPTEPSEGGGKSDTGVGFPFDRLANLIAACQTTLAEVFSISARR